MNDLQIDIRRMASLTLDEEREALEWRIAMIDEHIADPIDADVDGITMSYGREFLVDWLAEVRAEIDRREKVKFKPRHKRAVRPQVDRFERIRRLVPLESFCAQERIHLIHKGRDSLFAHCPLPGHPEDSGASFHVTPSKGLWHCFGCQKSGDLIHLAMLRYQIDRNIDAVKRLEEKFGIVEPPSFAVPPKRGSDPPSLESEFDMVIF